MHYGDGAVGLVHTAKQRQSNGVIPSHGDHSGQGPACSRNARLARIAGGLTHQDAIVAFFNLLDGPGIVVAGCR